MRASPFTRKRFFSATLAKHLPRSAHLEPRALDCGCSLLGIAGIRLGKGLAQRAIGHHPFAGDLMASRGAAACALPARFVGMLSAPKGVRRSAAAYQTDARDPAKLAHEKSRQAPRRE